MNKSETDVYFYENGHHKHEISYKNQVKDGWEKKWHDNGQMSFKRKWLNGFPKPPGMKWNKDGSRIVIKPDLDKDKCLFCGACIGVCPTNAMLLEYNESNIWISEDCTDCLFCTRVCPVGALSYPEDATRNTTFEEI